MSRKKRGYFFLFVFCAGLALPLQGQSRKRLSRDEIFEAGVLLGANFSQMDGDYFTGFDKVGWYGGLRGIVNLNRRTSLYLEMVYSQKGSKIPHGIRLTSQAEVRDRLVDIQYMDVPILLHYQLRPDEQGAFFEFGPVISRLIQTRIQERPPEQISGTVYEEIKSDFSTTDIGLLAGVGFPIFPQLDLNLRYTLALRPFYENEDFVAPIPFSQIEKEVEFLRNYHLSLFVSYKFFSTKR